MIGGEVKRSTCGFARGGIRRKQVLTPSRAHEVPRRRRLPAIRNMSLLGRM